MGVGGISLSPFGKDWQMPCWGMKWSFKDDDTILKLFVPNETVVNEFKGEE